jgi:hypothetical protein
MTANPAVLRILPAYVPMSKERCDEMSRFLAAKKAAPPGPSAEEAIEDAGLDDDDFGREAA